ncbi:glycosyl hydrolase family 109 protein, partial [Arthrobacter sp. Hiyo6]
MNEILNVAITGCGVIGRTHAAALQEFPQTRIVALVDAIPDAAQSLADYIEQTGRPRPAVFTTISAALAGADIDLVALATPSGLHIEQGLEVLAAGKHVVIEKPLDVD